MSTTSTTSTASQASTTMSAASTIAIASLRRWVKSRPVWARPMCDAWLAAADALVTARGLGDKSKARLRRLVIEDVNDQVELLGGDEARRECTTVAPDAVRRAWCEWYPAHVAAMLRELEASEPHVLMSEADQRAVQSERDKTSDAERKQAARDAARGQRLLAMLQASDGVIRWEPERVAAQLTKGCTVQHVGDAAEALERLGLASWGYTPSGRKWALQLTPSGSMAIPGEHCP